MNKSTGKQAATAPGKSKKSIKNKELKFTPGGRSPFVVVRHSRIHGRGVFAKVDIPKGTRIIEYTGERMSHEKADRLYGALHEGSSHTMLFAATDEVVIDGTKKGGPARWINHSCAPNCEAIEEEGRVFIDATRSIKAGQELGYDYNLVLEERHTPKLKREHPCHCGARNCRGTLLGKKR
jgi:SET domain-containing protein